VYPAIDVIRIRGGQATADHPRDDGEGTSGRAAGFIAMLQPFVQLVYHTFFVLSCSLIFCQLPDMDLALNTRVEPRIIVPWTGSNTTEPLTHDPAQYVPDWQGQGSTWDAYRRHCPPRTSARALYRSLRPARGGSRGSLLSDSAGPVPGPFAENTIARTDFCAVPSAHTLHGLFFCDWRAVPARLPILSAARAPGFGDVRVPSHYYYWPSRRHTYGFDPVNLVVREQDAREVPWAAKHDKIWWRGPSTGGGGSPPGYAERYQRHRLLALAAENGTAPRTVTFPDPVAPRRMRQARVPVGALNADTFDLAFTRVAGEGNWPGGAAGLREDFAFEEDGTALGARWASKYALDIDGVGHSGVFLALMESDSAVLKAGVFAEFWEHWAVPWLHYVPLSAGYAELYDLHAYFSGPGPATRAAAGIPLNATSSDEGDRRLRRIARAGKQWRRTIARSVDMEGTCAGVRVEEASADRLYCTAYVFRLMLEYARLWADDRESMDFVL
jgi:hypothetical protein